MIGRLLRAPVAGRTWRELAYALVSLLLSIPTFVMSLFGAVFSVLSLLTVGLPFLVGVLSLARGTVGYFRGPARWLLGWDWPSPHRIRAGNPFRWGVRTLRDPTGWRALAYGFLKLPVMAAAAYSGVSLLLIGVVTVTYPFWWPVSPTAFGLSDPNSWGVAWVFALEGAGALLAFPWLVRLFVAIDRLLVRALLEPDSDRARIAALEASRSELRADAAALLRKVERDLHDGTQARLVGLGVTLARIERRTPNPEAKRLTEQARHDVAEALVELREIVRGMHPPALDDGLPTALATLAARSAVPVELAVEVTDRPGDAAASALYFVAAELLTNVAKHAQAARVQLRVNEEPGWVRLEVADDGRGGARAGAGSGLAGLARRVSALDGSLTLDSPAGGPTSVVVRLPKEA